MSPGGGGVKRVLEFGGAGSAPPPPRAAGGPGWGSDELSSTPAPEVPPQDSGLKTQDPLPNAQCLVPSALPPDPESLINHLLNTLARQSPDTALTSLHACFAKDATLNGDPVPSDPDDFLDDIDDDTRDALTDLSFATYTRAHHSPDTRTYHLHLAKKHTTHHATVTLHPGGTTLRAVSRESAGGAGVLPADPSRLREQPNGRAGILPDSGARDSPPSDPSRLHEQPTSRAHARASDPSRLHEQPSIVPWRIHTFTIEPPNNGFR
jgi:hypothetical protein